MERIKTEVLSRVEDDIRPEPRACQINQPLDKSRHVCRVGSTLGRGGTKSINVFM